MATTLKSRRRSFAMAAIILSLLGLSACSRPAPDANTTTPQITVLPASNQQLDPTPIQTTNQDEAQLIPLDASEVSEFVLDESVNSTGPITLGPNNIPTEPLEVHHGPADFDLEDAVELPLGPVIE